MKRLSVVSLTLFTIVLILNTSLLTYAWAQNSGNPLKDYGFDLCDGDPCFFGVQPGMAWDQVETVLTSHGAVVIKEITVVGGAIGARVGKTLALIRPNTKRTKVGTIQLQLELTDFKAPFPELGHIITQYGQPCGISFQALQKDGLSVRYPHFMMSYHTIDQRLSFQSDAVSALFSDRNLCPSADYVVRWSGFTRVETYHQLYQP